MEIIGIPDIESRIVARALDRAWFSRYSRPVECVHDNGSEFVGIDCEFQELLQSYGVKSKLTTVRNPQANGILERTHEVIGNILRSTRLMSQNLSTFEGSTGTARTCHLGHQLTVKFQLITPRFKQRPDSSPFRGI